MMISSIKNFLLISLTFSSLNCFQQLSEWNDFAKRNFVGFVYNRVQSIILMKDYPVKSEIKQDYFDMLRNDLKIKVIPANKSIIGEIKSSFLIVKPTKKIEIDFFNNLSVKEIKSNFHFESFIHKNNLIRINFSNELQVNDTLYLSIWYEGKPKKLGFASFVFEKNEDGDMIYTLSEPYFTSTWMPIKDIPSDKFISSVRVIVPKNLVAISNGTLIKKEKVDDSLIAYQYVSDYPISPYLVFICASNYSNFNSKYQSISGKEILLDYYVYPSHLEDAKIDFELIPEIMRFFETTFGEYPFKNDKYGMAEFEWNLGAMEHQTMTCIGSRFITGKKLNTDLIVHELAHQWFGNAVTCSTWKDVWLNEGFAKYSEYLFKEYLEIKSNGEVKTKLNPNEIFYGSLYDPDGFLFNNTVYNKGAWVLHMLRYEMGDSLFFLVLKNYYNTYKFKNASTEEFKKICEDVSGRNLNRFFRQWVYSKYEKPFYKLDWFSLKDGNEYICEVRLEQFQPWHIYEIELPIKIKLINGKDYNFKLMNNRRNQVYKFKFEAEVLDVLLDYHNKILKSVKYFNEK